MNATSPHPKKSRSPKARRKSPAGPRCRAAKSGGASVPASQFGNGGTPQGAARQEPRPTKSNLRREFRAWRASLPTALERDTMLVPLWIAESVVQEVERFLKADLPAGFAERLAARAEHIYPRHKHFKKMLNRSGNAGRDYLSMYMRHWTAGWLKRDRNPLHKKLPYAFGMGRPLLDTVPKRM